MCFIHGIYSKVAIYIIHFLKISGHSSFCVSLHEITFILCTESLTLLLTYALRIYKSNPISFQFSFCDDKEKLYSIRLFCLFDSCAMQIRFVKNFVGFKRFILLIIFLLIHRLLILLTKSNKQKRGLQREKYYSMKIQ